MLRMYEWHEYLLMNSFVRAIVFFKSMMTRHVCRARVSLCKTLLTNTFFVSFVIILLYLGVKCHVANFH